MGSAPEINRYRDSPPFYRAVVAMAFHYDALVERTLQDVMRSAPDSWEAAEARRLRAQFRLHSGRKLHKAVGKPQPSRSRYSMKLGNLQIPLTINGKNVEYLLDTGAVHSVISETEAKRQFADLVNACGKEEKLNGAGASGIIEYKAMMLLELKLHVGGFETLLRPAEITLKEDLGFGHHGNFGLDLLNQARVITIDFRAMKTTLEGRRPDARGQQHCP